MASLVVAGFAVGCVMVLAGGKIGPIGRAHPFTTWLGLLSPRHVHSGDVAPGIVLLAAVFALLALWLWALHGVRAGWMSLRSAWALAAAWAAPLIAGPPLFSSDIYAYVAQGLLARGGIDVYAHGADALGNTPAALAVDRLWRQVPSPYGPVQTLIEHLAVSSTGGNVLGALLMLRLVTVLATVAIGVLAVRLAIQQHQVAGSGAGAVLLTVANPLMLLHVVSPAHVEALMGALLLGCLLAARRQRWVLAVVLGCVAGSVKAPAFLAVVVIVVLHVSGRHGTARLRALTTDVLAAAGSVLTCAAAVPHGLGWISSLRAPTLGYTFYAPVSVVANVLRALVTSLDWDALRAGVRAAGMVLALAAVVALLVTVRRLGAERATGYGLLTVAVLSPVLYPWYLVWGLLCLAPIAGRRLRVALVALSALGCVISPPGLPRIPTLAVVAAAALIVTVTAGLRMGTPKRPVATG